MLNDNKELHILCAAGVTFMFLIALQRALRTQKKMADLPDLHTYLDLVAIGTICDMVPLTGLNRTFVQKGLRALPTSPFPGVQALIEKTQAIHEGDIGFRVGPIINAGSRMGAHDMAAQLLTSQDLAQAHTLCDQLIALNTERKTALQDALEEAFTQAEEQKNDGHIVIHHAAWSAGIIGLIAARVSERHHKPTWVMSTQHTPFKGAARSPIKAFNLAHILHQALSKNLILGGGGHQAAAGFTIEQANIDAFKAFVEEEYTYPHEYPRCSIHGFLPESPLARTAEHMKPLKPFGMHNPEPCFAALNVSNIQCVKKGERFARYQAVYENQTIYLVRFGDATCIIRQSMESQDSLHVVGSIDNGHPSYPTFIIRDAFLATAQPSNIFLR